MLWAATVHSATWYTRGKTPATPPTFQRSCAQALIAVVTQASYVPSHTTTSATPKQEQTVTTHTYCSTIPSDIHMSNPTSTIRPHTTLSSLCVNIQLQSQYLARQSRATHKGARGSGGIRNKTITCQVRSSRARKHHRHRHLHCN
jgi:hypothetical protein